MRRIQRSKKKNISVEERVFLLWPRRRNNNNMILDAHYTYRYARDVYMKTALIAGVGVAATSVEKSVPLCVCVCGYFSLKVFTAHV
jgi:hypothetical protein